MTSFAAALLALVQPAPATPATPPRAPVSAGGPTRVVLVDRPGSVQSELSVAAPGPDRSVASGWAPYPVLSFVVERRIVREVEAAGVQL